MNQRPNREPAVGIEPTTARRQNRLFRALTAWKAQRRAANHPKCSREAGRRQAESRNRNATVGFGFARALKTFLVPRETFAPDTCRAFEHGRIRAGYARREPSSWAMGRWAA